MEEDLKLLRLVLKQKHHNSSAASLNNQNKSQTTNSPSSSSSSSSYDILEQLPNTISISFKNLIGHELVAKLANKVACSTGSACHSVPTASSSSASSAEPNKSSTTSPVYTPSEVLQAMKVSPEFGIGTLRLSLGRYSSEEEVDQIARYISEEVLSQWARRRL
jgi:cysteine sulfinate desulfinase/cysteine desulfurase-like protein